MSDYVDKVNIDGADYDIQDTSTKEQVEENTQKIEELENFDIYSLQETQTASKWIDNKQIYRKVFTGILTVTAGGITTLANISDLNIETVTAMDCLLEYESRSFTKAAADNGRLYTVATNSIGYFSTIDRTNTPFVVIIEYTKR